MKNKYSFLYVSVGILLITVTSLQFSSKEAESYSTENHIYIPSNLNFCGENVPIEIVDVKERMDREFLININLHSSTSLIIKRANKFFPVIEPILKKNGIPDDFKYLCVIESALANATSSAGAKGFWQFMPATAKEYNLEVSSTVDERNHLEKATEAACKYLKRAHNKFGNWTLVAASYNRGMGGIENQLNVQGVNDYYDMYLNEETSRYVFRILALKEIMENSDKYGYKLPKDALYRNVKTKSVAVNTSIPNLQTWALEQGVNYKTLRYHNPWLIDTSLNVSAGKTYDITIPLEGYKKK